jgi:hypothetical protein
MTSFAFILGLYPLVVANGASELARRGVGTPVFGRMILASFLGIFAIPPLYVISKASASGCARARGRTSLRIRQMWARRQARFPSLRRPRRNENASQNRERRSKRTFGRSCLP